MKYKGNYQDLYSVLLTKYFTYKGYKDSICYFIIRV